MSSGMWVLKIYTLQEATEESAPFKKQGNKPIKM